MADGSLEVFLRLLGMYGACLALGFALKRVARSFRPAAAAPKGPQGPGIGRKFKVFFAFQALLLSLSFWWLPGLALFLLILLGVSAYEVARLRRSAPSRPGYPFPAPAAYGLLALFGAAAIAYPLAGRPLASGAGAPFLAFLFLLVAVFDGYSQICGEIIGGARMVPRISPGKTWSGFSGGLAFCMAAAALGQPLIHPWLGAAEALAAGAAVGLLAFLGDITASWVKRRIGVKDFSDLLGPQGGVLDRADSLLWLGPALGVAALFLPDVFPGIQSR